MIKRLIVLSAFLLTGLSACRKDRTCTCEQNGTDLGTFTYTNVKRSEGRSFCATQQSQYQASYPGATCTLR